MRLLILISLVASFATTTMAEEPLQLRKDPAVQLGPFFVLSFTDQAIDKIAPGKECRADPRPLFTPTQSGRCRVCGVGEHKRLCVYAYGVGGFDDQCVRRKMKVEHTFEKDGVRLEIKKFSGELVGLSYSKRETKDRLHITFRAHTIRGSETLCFKGRGWLKIIERPPLPSRPEPAKRPRRGASLLGGVAVCCADEAQK